MRLKFILSALCILPLLLPAAELKLPASSWKFESPNENDIQENWWYKIFPDSNEKKEEIIRLCSEDGSPNRRVVLAPNVVSNGLAVFKGRVRFLSEESRLNVLLIYYYFFPSTTIHFIYGDPLEHTVIKSTGKIGEWQNFEVGLNIKLRRNCPDCGRNVTPEPRVYLTLEGSDQYSPRQLLALELESMTLSGSGVRSIKTTPRQVLKTDRGRLKQPEVPPNFTGNRFDANAAVFDSKKPSLPEAFNDSTLNDAQRISLNPDFELKLLTPFEQGERANQRARLKFPHPIDPGDPYPTPILADTCDGAFYAVMPNSREFFLAKFDPERSRWEAVREHVTLPAPRKKDDPRLTTAEERFDHRKDSLTRILHPDAPPQQPIAVPNTLLVNGENGFASISGRTPPPEFQSEKVRKLAITGAWSSPGSPTLLLGIPREQQGWAWNPVTGKAKRLPLFFCTDSAAIPLSDGYLFFQRPPCPTELYRLYGDDRPPLLLAGTPAAARRATHLRNLPGGGLFPMENCLGLRGRYLIVTTWKKLALLDLLDPAKSLLLQGFEFRFALIRPDSNFIRVIAQEGMFDLRPKGGWGELTDADFVEVKDNFLTRNNLDSAKLVPLKKLVTAVEATDPDLFRAEWKEFDGIDCLVLSWKEIPFNCEVKLGLDRDLEKSPVTFYGFLPRQLSGATLTPEERKIRQKLMCDISSRVSVGFPEYGIQANKGNTLRFILNKTDSAGELILAAIGK